MTTPRDDGGIQGIRFPVVADFSKQIARSYGLLLDDGFPLRGMFIISEVGILKHITINDIPIGRNVDECLRLIHAHKLIESTNGDVCIPVDWKPGESTIKFHPMEFKEAYRHPRGGSSTLAAVPEEDTPRPVVTKEGSHSGLSGIEEVDTKRRFDEVTSSNRLVVISFWAPWCKNCKVNLSLAPYVCET
jgi:hypothetical protein